MRPHAKRPRHGEVAEWSNVPDSKSGVRVTVPWVRIPPSPPKQNRLPSGAFFVLPERAGRLRALRVGFEGLGLQAQPSRIARLPSARRTASRAEGARCKAERHAPEAASPLRRSSDPRDRRQPGPAITHLLSAPRAAKPKTTTKKQHRSAPRPDPRDRQHPSAGYRTHPTGPHARSPISPRTRSSPHPPSITRTSTILQ